MPESSVIYNISFRDGACSILMANDDASIRDMGKEILGECGRSLLLLRIRDGKRMKIKVSKVIPYVER